MSYGIFHSVICHLSFAIAPILPVPLVERLVCRGWYLAVAPPDIEVVINGKARQHFKRGFGRLRRNRVSLGMAQQFTSDNHGLLL